MKKLILLVVALAFMLTPLTMAKAENEHLNDFYDNFESYEVSGNFVENDKTFTSNWTNNLFMGGEPLGMDKHIRELAKIEYENGENSNKAFSIDNASSLFNTFFYMAPANDFRVKNFNASFRVKFRKNHVGWVGLSVRKEENAHYTGTNNLLLIVQREKDSNDFIGHAHRCVGGTMSHLADLMEGGLYGDKLKLTENHINYSNFDEWVNFRYEVNNRNYKVYMNDNLLIDLTLDLKMFDEFGYVSFNCCQADILLDDFKVQVKDTQLPPAKEEQPVDPKPVDPKPDQNEDSSQNSEVKEEGKGCGSSVQGSLTSLSLVLAVILLIKRR